MNNACFMGSLSAVARLRNDVDDLGEVQPTALPGAVRWLYSIRKRDAREKLHDDATARPT